MTAITAEMVKQLRERTGAAMMSCKKALEKAQGDMEGAVDILKKAGEAKAAQQASRTAAEGMIVIAVSPDTKKAFMVEINSETDFVARDSHFVEFARTLTAKGLNANADTVEKVLTLSIGNQSTIEQTRQTLVAQMGENIQLRRVALFESDGIVGHYCHGQRIGVLVKLDRYLPELAKDLAMHIAAFRPLSVRVNEVPSSIVEKEREVFMAQASESGKPKNIIEKMVTGRLNKFLNEVSLLGQPFLKNSEITVGDLLKLQQAQVIQFVRFEVGEGIEKETKNFADEVMAQVHKDGK